MDDNQQSIETETPTLVKLLQTNSRESIEFRSVLILVCFGFVSFAEFLQEIGTLHFTDIPLPNSASKLGGKP